MSIAKGELCYTFKDSHFLVKKKCAKQLKKPLHFGPTAYKWCEAECMREMFYVDSLLPRNFAQFVAKQRCLHPPITISLIAFDERVTSSLQRVQLLHCACAYFALFARNLSYNHYAIVHAYSAANAQAQGNDPAR